MRRNKISFTIFLFLLACSSKTDFERTSMPTFTPEPTFITKTEIDPTSMPSFTPEPISMPIFVPEPTSFPTREPVETYVGDLVVNSGEELVIRDKTLELEGNLFLEDGSKLLMENAALVISQKYKGEFQIYARNANIILEDSLIETSGSSTTKVFGKLTGAELNIEITDNSTIYIENSQVYARPFISSGSKLEIIDSVVSFIYWMSDAHLLASNVTMGGFVFKGDRTSLPETLEFSGLKKNEEFDLILNTTADGGSLILQDSIILGAGWNFNFDWGFQKEIIIEDSEIDNIWIKFPPTEEWITISSLPHGLIEEYDIQEAVTGISLTYGIKLKNVELGHFKPEMLSTKATIRDSYAMVHPYDLSELIIEDSTLTTMNNYGCKRIEFENVTFLETIQFISMPNYGNHGFKVGDKVIGPGGYFYWVLKNSRIDVQEIVVALEEGTIEGDVKIISPKNFNNVSWIKGVITRIYPVIFHPNEAIVLMDDQGTTLWEGETDENGKVSFSITFNIDNYTNSFKLQSENSEQEVTFLSDTPIDFK
ncbi:MAG: hypothetical protein H8D34_23090 [Chloroflexi bacterium]|nr:hypothetical protein [Chloroflexota bacterium]MBL6960243.1 hypothetical protein [Anaerolineales bacterium]